MPLSDVREQVALGVVAGSGIASLLLWAILADTLSLAHVGLLVAYALVMLGVYLLACVFPTRRALAVEPTEALKAES